MRQCLNPLLDLLTAYEVTYCWGYPFHLVTQKIGTTFQLPSQLPDLYSLLQLPFTQEPDLTAIETPQSTATSSATSIPLTQIPPRHSA